MTCEGGGRADHQGDERGECDRKQHVVRTVGPRPDGPGPVVCFPVRVLDVVRELERRDAAVARAIEAASALERVLEELRRQAEALAGRLARLPAERERLPPAPARPGGPRGGGGARGRGGGEGEGW